MIEEIWKPISERPDVQASNLGRVIGARGNLLKQNDRKGYLAVGYGFVHRLVVSAFIGPIPPGMTVNHINGNKHDNNITNLEIMSQGDNARHSYRDLGRSPSGIATTGMRAKQIGEKHPRAYLTAEMVREIRARRAAGETLKSVADKFGISYSHANNIIKRRIWGSID